MIRSLRSYLRRRGATPEEIARAEREERLALLALDRQLLPGRLRYTFAEAAARADFDVDVARRLWRALGFPDPPEHARRFSDRDVDTLVTLQRRLTSSLLGGSDPQQAALVQYVRVIGGSLAKIAEVQSDQVVKAIRAARDAGMTDEQVAQLVPDAIDWERMSRLTDYGLRLQLRAASGANSPPTPRRKRAETLTVGFVDLVGYTALSQELEPEELGALVTRFEELAYDTVAEQGGRVVKTIGDEVMFVAEEASAAARIALRLTQSSAVDEILPDARAGLDCGDVLAQEGDYYGPVVNLASRLVEIARPGSVLASSAVHDALAEHPSFGWDRLRSRRIRDIGRVEVWKLDRADDTNPGNHEGSGTVRSA